MKLVPGTTAVVTGAASGIGRALALALARRGLSLALVDRDAAGLGRMAAIAGATTHAVDVADRGAMQALAADVAARHAHVRLLVNNAGMSIGGTFDEHTAEEFDRLMAVNFGGVVGGTRAFLPLLRREPGAHIVNLSSMLGFVALPGQTAYSASKFAIRGFSEALRAELAPEHIGVTTVHPGAIDTNIIRNARIADAAMKPRMERLSARFGMAPDKAARRILAAVEKNQARLVIGADARTLELLSRAAPALARWAIATGYRALSRSRS